MDRDYSGGFTLTELMVVLTITAILIIYSAPSFIDLIRANRLSTQTNIFITAMNLARSEAISRNERVLLCIHNGNQCGTTDQWEQGWIVFADQNGNSTIDTGELIRQFEPLQTGYLLRPNISTSSLIYYGDGRVRRGSGGLPLVTFRLCAPDAVTGKIAERTKELVINASGRMRIQKGREGKTLCP